MELLTALAVRGKCAPRLAVDVSEDVLSDIMGFLWVHLVVVLIENEDAEILTQLECVILISKQCFIDWLVLDYHGVDLAIVGELIGQCFYESTIHVDQATTWSVEGIVHHFVLSEIHLCIDHITFELD